MGPTSRCTLLFLGSPWKIAFTLYLSSPYFVPILLLRELILHVNANLLVCLSIQWHPSQLLRLDSPCRMERFVLRHPPLIKSQTSSWRVHVTIKLSASVFACSKVGLDCCIPPVTIVTRFYCYFICCPAIGLGHFSNVHCWEAILWQRSLQSLQFLLKVQLEVQDFLPALWKRNRRLQKMKERESKHWLFFFLCVVENSVESITNNFESQ